MKKSSSRGTLAGGLIAGLVIVTGLTGAGSLSARATGTPPPESTFFSTANAQESSTIQSSSDGDLWASCWADDGNLYAANGDGKGFSTSGPSSDIAVSRIAGTPGSLTGSTLATGNAISQTWTAGSYNRKPTGMVCVNGTIYLAVQDLSTSFNDAPAATVVKSTDHGVTWTWDHSAPMFNNHVFTTMFFADFGQNSANASDGYVYVYGLDNNWRTSFDGSVPNPTDLFLARVPSTSVQTRSTWQFYTGTSGGTPTWSTNIALKQPVLHDDRTIYPSLINAGTHNLTVLGQGGVLYDKPLNRYIYSSWTEYTYEFYESPSPTGPWSHFLTKDFGGYPWTQSKNGGYATTIPSKFLSSDGLSMYVQSNVCSCGGAGTSVYNYALRSLNLTVAPTAAATNSTGSTNVAQTPGTVPIERVAHFANNSYYNDGNLTNSEDDWNNEHKSGDSSWWGYTWPRQYTINKVVYTTGAMYPDGGWFSSNVRVQVRHGNTWTDVASPSTVPAYPYSSAAGTNASYTFTFTPVSGDGVRVIGVPGGSSTFTSVGEVSAYYSTGGFTVQGAIATKYNSSGGAAGPEGGITSNETTTADGIGRFNTFQNGAIYWTPNTGAQMVYGLIYSKWASLGYEQGVLGYPTTDETSDPLGRRSTFQNGYIIFNSSNGVATAYRSNGTVI
ncbi:hypothetical protein B7R22_14165 [Subtercola boreus]|uniref:Uncharacterized protein n=1 Tax=Subtercola boreus TaxID=120213 RepID=A0A3E0VUF4_9MICO|nr:hypothetical protein [Subtercola boreus]RFA13139.1 hypothetical protein B7R22_14165 [Subtercola boreus]